MICLFSINFDIYFKFEYCLNRLKLKLKQKFYLCKMRMSGFLKKPNITKKDNLSEKQPEQEKLSDLPDFTSLKDFESYRDFLKKQETPSKTVTFEKSVKQHIKQPTVTNKIPIGDKGPAGDKGPVGDKGPAGDKGVVGDKGPIGDKGPKGVVGDKGPVGEIVSHKSVIYNCNSILKNTLTNLFLFPYNGKNYNLKSCLIIVNSTEKASAEFKLFNVSGQTEQLISEVTVNVDGNCVHELKDFKNLTKELSVLQIRGKTDNKNVKLLGFELNM